MIDKYQNFIKLSKTQQCSIYQAVNRQTSQSVLLKRFTNKELTWDEILKSKNMQFSQKSRMFPKMIQIFRNKADYYIVYERPNGHSLHEVNQIGKMQLQDFYIIFDDLLRYVKELKSLMPTLYIVPQWIFMHRKTIKFIHFQPFFLSREMINSDHVYLYKLDKELINPEQQSAQTVPNNQWYNNLVTSTHRKNIMYTLAIIAYYLLTGTQKKQSQTQSQYSHVLDEIELNAERIISKITKDKALGHMIGKMLGSNTFQIPSIDRVYNFIHTKVLDTQYKKKLHTSVIHIQLEKLRLENSQIQQTQHSKRRRRRLRACCEQKEASIQKIEEEQRRLRKSRQVQSKFHPSRQIEHEQIQKSQRISIKKAIQLPTIKRKQHRRMKTTMDMMNTTNSKPLMFRYGVSRIKYG